VWKKTYLLFFIVIKIKYKKKTIFTNYNFKNKSHFWDIIKIVSKDYNQIRNCIKTGTGFD